MLVMWYVHIYTSYIYTAANEANVGVKISM